MNRKNTILIAVMINAGLLAVLLIAALVTQEEAAPPSVLMGDAPLQKIDHPLFGDSVDLALRQPAAAEPQQPPIQIPLQEAARQEPPLAQLPIPSPPEPVVHTLPPLAPEPAAPLSAPVASLAAPSPFIEVTVKKGDTLEKIAKLYHTSVDEIIKINRLPSSFLRIGQVLKIPAEKPISSLPKSPLPNSKVEKKTEGGAEYYTVKVGDNPWTIAAKHHIKVEELLRLNALNEERARKLKPGDRLRTR